VSYRYIGSFLTEKKKAMKGLELDREELLPEIVDEDSITEPNPEKIYHTLMKRIQSIAGKRHLSTRQIRSLVESFTRLEAFKRQILSDSEDSEHSYETLLTELKEIEKGEKTQ